MDSSPTGSKTSKADQAAGLSLVALPGLPLVRAGDDLATLVLDGCRAAGWRLCSGDILVVAQKIVSKSEGRFAQLDEVTPSAEAQALALKVGKDPRLVELILGESAKVIRHRPGVLVVEHRLGLIMANAGIDKSNVGPGEAGEQVLLLPLDPDASARRLRSELASRTGDDVAVIISDSVGRAWRMGTVGIALGAAGLPARLDLRGRLDLFGRPLAVSEIGLADEIAAAASLLQGQADEGRPVVLLRGLGLDAEARPAADLIREEEDDLFR